MRIRTPIGVEGVRRSPPLPGCRPDHPWNFPFLNAGLDGIPALAAGASLLLKPSEVTPLTAVEFARGWTEIGAPPVLALVNGYAETGAAVIANSDYVHFTGSTATGRKVAVACAERLIPYSLELGGKDPAVVLADVDQSMTCMTEETFGPTLPVVKVADEGEAIRLANDSTYGLSATVWTGDTARGERVARRLEAGAVNVNDVMVNGFSFALPMPGGSTPASVPATVGPTEY